MQTKTFMKTFLEQHDFVYERPAADWVRGLPLGNASIGAMVWGDGKPLVLTLDRTDIWELRRKPIDWSTYNYANLKGLLEEGNDAKVYQTFGQQFNEEMYSKGLTQTRMVPGRMEIEWGGGEVLSHEGRLDLFQAQALGTLALKKGRGEYRVFTDAVRDVIVAEVSARDGASIKRITSRGSKCKFENHGYPDPEEGKTGEVHWRLQRQIGRDGYYGGELAVAWIIEKSAKSRAKNEKQTVYCCIAGSREADQALHLAATQVREAVRIGAGQLFKEHCEWWANYWTKSFVAIPNVHMENLYYAELYKLGCQMQQGKPYPSGQGMWCPDDSFPPWSAQWGFNLNEQIDTWATITSNHIDEVNALSELLWRWLPVNKELCRKFYGVDGAMLIHGSDFDGYEVPGWYCANLWAGCGPWACWTLWQIYLTTQDTEFLRDRAYPLMKEHMRQYFGILEKWDDGRYHIPRNPSPEWLNNEAAAWGRDDAGNHGIIRGMAKALIQAEEILGVADGDAQRWRETLENLAPYPLDEHGLQLMTGVQLTDSHRTFPQLLGIYPFRDINPENGDADRHIISQSFKMVDFNGMGNWCGYTVSWMAAITAGVGDAGRAYEMLRRYADACTIENSFHVNGDVRDKGLFCGNYLIPTPEGGFAAAGAILEMLLQSWNGLIRLFPATPSWWPDAAFDDLRAEGAFLVSARRKRGETTWVRVRSEAGVTCRMRNPFGGPACLVDDATGEERILKGDTLTFATAPGRRYTLTKSGNRRSSALPKFPRDAAETNWYGLKKLARF